MNTRNPRSQKAKRLLGDSLTFGEVKKTSEELFDDYETWILQDPLNEVFICLLALYIHDPGIMENGQLVALIGKRLLAEDRGTGGPYGSDSPKDREANVAIAHLFTLLGAPLPNVDAYVKNDSSLSNTMKELIALTHLHTKDNRSNKGDKVTNIVERDIRDMSQPLNHAAMAMWKEMKESRAYDEACSLSLDFARSLRNRPAEISDEMCHILAVANMYFWMAYVSYDDFIDDEGDVSTLPVANVFQRKSLFYYKSILPENTELIEDCFNGVDGANAWELENCRFLVEDNSIMLGSLPVYGNRMILAQRAFGHILGPMIISEKLGVSKKVKDDISKALKHYLIARQLNDDLHDWVEDFENGHISYVVASLLRGAKVKLQTSNTESVLAVLRPYFFEKGMAEMCDKIFFHVQEALDSLSRYSLFDPDTPIIKTIEHMKEIAIASLDVRNENQIFIENIMKK